MRYTEMFRNEPDVLTVPEAAKLLRIGKNQAYELVKNGSLGAIRLGKKIIIPKAYELVKNGSIGAIRLGKKIIIPKPALVDFCRNERNYLVLLPK